MTHLCLITFAILFQYGQAYNAAVVEYSPLAENTPIATILKNLEEYKSHIQKAKTQGVDIIVFPEYGLTTLLDDPEGYALDLLNDTKVLPVLRCLAIEHNMYLVVNLLEEVKEDHRKTKYYNTNLVYNRAGQIIAKYRKINLFNEPNLTPGTERVTFDTDFGVTFGLFTCFDILYHNPSITILDNKAIADVIYPHAWFSTMPFYTSLTVQYGYAAATGVNLLAANYNQPKGTHGGSGIYLGEEKNADIYISGSLSNKLIIVEIKNFGKRRDTRACSSIDAHGLPRGLPTASISDFVTLKDFKASDYRFQNVDLSQEKVSSLICYGRFCCTFNITIAQPATPGEIYKLMAYDGIVPFDRSTAHIRVCSLLACANDSNESCGSRIKRTTKFSRIGVSGTVPKEGATFYRPLTLNYNLRPILESTYCENGSGDGKSSVHFNTLAEQQGVLLHGIFGKVNAGN